LLSMEFSGTKGYRQGETFFAFAKSWPAAARQIGVSLPCTSALASRGGALAGYALSVPQIAVVGHALGVTLTSLSLAAEC
jgi:L-lactate permease